MVKFLIQLASYVGVINLYSRRKKRQGSQRNADFYQYDEIPQGLRIQIVHIWTSAFGRWYKGSGSPWDYPSPSTKWWKELHDALAREKSVGGLGRAGDTPDVQCLQYLLTADTDSALDIIELSFKIIKSVMSRYSEDQKGHAGISQDADDAIIELNERFREHGVGYQFVECTIVRVDSQFLHAEVVTQALALLHESGFSGPADEFMRAFDHHRKNENKDAIADALNAFESTMKAICDARQWTYRKTDTAKPLLDLLFQKGLVPSDLQSHFTGLRSTLESGLPTVANPNRHGQGSRPTAVPSHYVSYALHLVGSNIVFLVECHKNLK